MYTLLFWSAGLGKIMFLFTVDPQFTQQVPIAHVTHSRVHLSITLFTSQNQFIQEGYSYVHVKVIINYLSPGVDQSPEKKCFTLASI